MSRPTDEVPFADLQLYVGDIHNHCSISYGHGSLEDALVNAKLQLDFASVTGHAQWHDMHELPAEPAAARRHTIEYHEAGFRRLEERWPYVQDAIEAANDPGSFVTFLSYEWHSSAHGDYCVYFEGGRGDIIRAGSLEELRAKLRQIIASGTRAMMIPHHIAYGSRRRGLNWDDFSPELSPVIEMMSMHGCGESVDSPYPYLHTMGPRSSRGSMLEGLKRNQLFGVVGSTDHHSAHPGSYGHGRMAVWAEALTRRSVWDAIAARRTYAITGERIELKFAIDGAPMGSDLPWVSERRIHGDVSALTPIESVDVLKNGVVHRRFQPSPAQGMSTHEDFRGSVEFTIGWGERGVRQRWDVELDVEGGDLLDVEPRFRGTDVVDPDRPVSDTHQVSSWSRGETSVRFSTETAGNETTTTDSTQGVVLTIEGGPDTRVIGSVNGRPFAHSIRSLRSGNVVDYLGGGVSPAFTVGRAISWEEASVSFEYFDHDADVAPSSYYVRVRLTNGQYAWSSPVWVGRR